MMFYPILSGASDPVTGVGSALAYSGLGFLIVFVGLIALMIVIVIMAKLMKKNKPATPAAAAAPVAPAASVPAAPVPAGRLAPGSAGEIKLYDVPDKTAAMIMAIVANQLQKPLNELRFKSIKEVK